MDVTAVTYVRDMPAEQFTIELLRPNGSRVSDRHHRCQRRVTQITARRTQKDTRFLCWQGLPRKGQTMKKGNTILYAAVSVAILLCIALFAAVAQTPGGEVKFKKNQKTVHLIPSLEGADLFHAYCATCHGAAGKGDGPMASVLETPLSDLTTIAKRNGGNHFHPSIG